MSSDIDIDKAAQIVEASIVAEQILDEIPEGMTAREMLRLTMDAQAECLAVFEIIAAAKEIQAFTLAIESGSKAAIMWLGRSKQWLRKARKRRKDYDR